MAPSPSAPRGLLARLLSRRLPFAAADPDTGALTPDALVRLAGGVRSEAARSAVPVSVVTIDVVPRAGEVPEAAMTAVAAHLWASVRTRDRVARTGPDRLVVLLAADPAYAQDVVERVHRTSVRRLRGHRVALRVGLASRPADSCADRPAIWLPDLLDASAEAPRLG